MNFWNCAKQLGVEKEGKMHMVFAVKEFLSN